MPVVFLVFHVFLILNSVCVTVSFTYPSFARFLHYTLLWLRAEHVSNAGARANLSLLQLCYNLPELAGLLFKDITQSNPNSFPGVSEDKG